jgi:uncharacterized RDD family membrane protein YckC
MEPNGRRKTIVSVLICLMCLGLGTAILSAQEKNDPEAAPAVKSEAQAETGKKKSPSPLAKKPQKPALESESDENLPPEWPVDREHNRRGERVRIGVDQQIGPDQKVREFVTILGNSDLAGETESDMVTIFGNAKMTGKVGHDMVTVFGDAEVDGPVNHDLTVVFGNLKLGPKAAVEHDCVVVFGKLNGDVSAVPQRQVIEFLPWFSSLGKYIRSGPLLGRLLPPKSGLAWIVVALHFVLYFLIAVILPKPTGAAVKRLDENFFLSFGVGLLIMILLAPVMILLTVTVVGLILVPVIVLADIALAVLGKTSTLEFIGRQVLQRFRSDANEYRILSFLIGFLIVTVIYMIPILGLLVWLILRPLALGAAVLAVFGTIKKNGNGSPVPGIPVCSTPGTIPPPIPPAPGTADPISGGVPPGTMPLAAAAVATDPAVTVLPRAGFWIRTAATALDFVLLFWLIPLSHRFLFFLLIWIAYHIAMWTWKGTTIGGIICRIKLVRADGRSVDVGVAVVRALSAVFSAVGLLLGFFWAGWTRTRQSWHDLIADTVIVRVPRAISLI